MADLKHTLILEVALPDFHCDDYFDDPYMVEALHEHLETDAPTPEQIGEAALEESGETAGRHVRLLILVGSKDGNFLERVDGFVVGARVVPRAPDHEREKDERLDWAEERWIKDEARRLREPWPGPEVSEPRSHAEDGGNETA